MTGLPYRPNVGAVLFNPEGLTFIGRRADLPDRPGAWQWPQGGIDADEDPARAVLRELREEIGTDKAVVIGEHGEWLTYDLPVELLATLWGGRFRGQRQRWYALRFTGTDADIDLAADAHPEFVDWRWAPIADVPALAVPFKRPIYDVLVRDFARFAAPV